jgi:DNA polymerase-3 subunit beta
MKVSLLQQNIDIGLSITSRVIASTNSLPILGNVLINTSNGSIELQATNLELSVKYSLPAKIEEEGNVSVPARLLFDIIHSLADDKIQLSSDKDNLNIRSDGFNSVINGLSATDFPKIPQINTTNSIELSTSELISSLEEVLPAVSLDESRPILAGILFKTSNNLLTLAATDSYRLAENKLKIKLEKEISIIIPYRAINELIRITSILNPEKIIINFTETEIIFEVGQAQIISQIIEGQYPQYAKIIPEKSITKALVNKSDLTRCIKLASLFSRENAHSIELEIGNKDIKINSQAADIGTNSSSIECKIEGKPLKINVNAKYLLDAISAIKQEKLQLGFSGKLDPCVLKPDGKFHSEYIHIIMPLRS